MLTANACNAVPSHVQRMYTEGVTTTGDECSRVGPEISTGPKRTALQEVQTTGREEIVWVKNEMYTQNKYFCDHCGKELTHEQRNIFRQEGKAVVLCAKHFSQQVHFHKFLDCSPEDIKGMNSYVHSPQGVYVLCFNRKNQESGRFLIDETDLILIANYRWRYWKGRFFTGNKSATLVHTLLLKPKAGQVVDHINGDSADYRRSNLRVTSIDKADCNRAIHKDNRSGFMGVCWDKSRNRWMAEITQGKNKLHLGRYKDLCEAVYVRYIAEQQVYGEFRSVRKDAEMFRLIENVSKARKSELKQYVYTKLNKNMFSHVGIAPEQRRTNTQQTDND